MLNSKLNSKLNSQLNQNIIWPLLTKPSNSLTSPTLFLAPMEGVTDWVMRDILTGLGPNGIDHCVTEFLRITDQLMPASVFYKNCPELKTQSKTRHGTPVFIQLLGSQPDALALNALKAIELGCLGIDLNFGCPAPTVNRHDGGATLLKSSHRLFDIVNTVRKSVPANIPVTAKIRLGFDDPSACLENSKAIEEAGASWLTVHCRTKTDGYKPPAYWEWIPKIKEICKIPIVTNGEITYLEDFLKCDQVAQTQAYMIGRGALKDPLIFKKIKNNYKLNSISDTEIISTSHLESVKKLIPDFYQSCCFYANDSFAVARTKAWLKQLSTTELALSDLFSEVKVLTNPKEFQMTLFNRLENL